MNSTNIKEPTFVSDSPFDELIKAKKEHKFTIVKELEEDSLIIEDVKLECRGKPLDRYFFRNLGLYIKETWFAFIYACQMCIQTYTNFRNFVPNVKSKWMNFKRFWKENWKPLVFLSRIGEFLQDYQKWVRTPRRPNQTGRRRFFCFYLFAFIFGLSLFIMMFTTPEGGIDEFGSWVSYNYYDYNATTIWIIFTLCAGCFIQFAFGFNNIYKRFLNLVKRYPLAMGIIIGLCCIGFYFVLLNPYLGLWALDNQSSNYDLMYNISLVVWGVIWIGVYLLIFFDGYSNIIARFFFDKGVDGTNTLSRNLKGWAYLLPSLVPLFVFTFFPMINCLLMGFTILKDDFVYSEWGFFEFWKRIITNQDNFIQNHLTLMWFKDIFSDPRFLHSIISTTIIAFVTVPLCTIIALLIAILLNSIKRAQGLFQTIYFLPYVTAMTAITAVWRLLLANNGPINFIFNSDIDWLGSTEPMFKIGSKVFSGMYEGNAQYIYSRWAYPVYPQLIAYVIYSIWDGLAFKIVIFLSGLQSIDKQVYQAADLDGATSFRKFMKITVPLLGPILLFNTLTSLIGAFKVYTATKTLFLDLPQFETIVYYLFSFINATRYDLGSAVALVLFLFLLCLTLIRMFFTNRAKTKDARREAKYIKKLQKQEKLKQNNVVTGGIQ